MQYNENKVREILSKVAPQATETNHTIKIDLLTEDLYFDDVAEFVDRVTEELRTLVISNSFDKATVSSHHGGKVITEDGVEEKAKNVSIVLKHNDDEDITADLERFIDKLLQLMSIDQIESKNTKADWVSKKGKVPDELEEMVADL